MKCIRVHRAQRARGVFATIRQVAGMVVPMVAILASSLALRAPASSPAGGVSGTARGTLPPPAVTLTPATGTHVTSPSLSVQLDACGSTTMTATMTLRGSDVAPSFSGSDNPAPGCPQTGTTWTGNVSLVSSANAFSTTVCAGASCTTKTATWYYDPPVPVATTITLSPASATRIAGGTASVHAAVFDQVGQPMSVTPMWSTSASGVATVQAVTGSPQDATITAVAAGTATITATSGSASGSASITVVAASIALAGNPGTSSTAVGTSGLATFRLTNNTAGAISPGTPTLTGCSGTIANCSIDAFTAPAAGASVDIVVHYDGASQTSAQALGMTVTAGSLSAQATVSVAVTSTQPSYALTVTPSPSTSTAVQTTSGTATYAIQNTSTNTTGSLTITFAVSGCTVRISGCTTPASISLAQGASQNVSVTYHAVAAGTASLGLTASATGASPVTGTVAVTITASSQPAIEAVAAGAFPGGAITRDACLTIAAGGNAAYECGALRLVHPLPTTLTYGQARTPTLLYNSAQAAPGAILGVDLTITGPLPTSVQATLRIGGQTRVRTFAWDTTWTDGLPRRVSVPVDAVDLALTSGSGGVLLADTIVVTGYRSGSVTSADTVTGTVAIVDRRSSPFGAGWWLDGLEQIVTVAGNSNQRLWIGGDGSTRVYTDQGSNTWIAVPTLDRPDTLEYVPGDSAWHRHLGNGAYVEFNTSGQHRLTRDALGRTTTLGYTTFGGQSVLGSIVLPVQTGTTPTYAFTYALDSASIGRVNHVTATTGTTSRLTNIYAATGRISDIEDPIGTVSFAYNTARQLVQRINPLRDTTMYGYDEAGLLRFASIDTRRTDTFPEIRNTFCAAEGRSLTTCGGGAVNVPVLTSKAYTWLDGPRADVPDSTTFGINSYGAPDVIRNALGERDSLTRSSIFPLLVATRTDRGGFQQRVTYDGSGLVDSLIAIDPRGTSANAVTRYHWDHVVEQPDSVIAATGTVSTRAYDHATHTLTWAQMGGDTTRFAYTNGLVASAVRVANQATDSFTYDTLGNLASHTAPLVGTTTLARDAMGRDSVVTVPVATGRTRSELVLHDLAGRDTLRRTTGDAAVLTIRQHFDAAGRLLWISQSGNTDPNGIGPVTHTFSYDVAGRQVGDSLSGSEGHVSSSYDRAGNLIASGRALLGRTTTYDALNRPLAVSSGYSSAAFTYDSLGRLRTANNPFARIARGYDRGGALVADTLWIATVGAQPNTPDANDFSVHRYITTYALDAAGRRIAMTRPAALGGDTISYTYDARTGGVASVRSEAGTARYHYDLLGRLDSLIRRSGLPDSVPETWTYDLASRANTRRVTVGSDALYSEGFTYDSLGRILKANGTDSVAYDGLGQAIGSNAYGISESRVVDALGNRVSNRSVRPHGGGGNDIYTYVPGTARLKFIDRSGGTMGDTTFYDTDILGNVYNELHVMWSFPSGTGYHLDDFTPEATQTNRPIGTSLNGLGLTPQRQANTTANSFEENNRVRRSSFSIDSLYGAHTLPSGLSILYHATEDYRYDALGRRIWTRVTRDSTCAYAQPSTRCLNSVTRTVWDGDQIAGEIRVADTTTAVLDGDRDTSLRMHAGVVRYTHGDGLDHPLAVTKIGGMIVYPLTDWRGSIGSGVCHIGTNAARRCAAGDSLQFPQRAGGIFGAANSANGRGAPSWYGSLIDGLRDGSGKTYQRNRYLDPETGRFTQEDPIGLAGGMNLYGFAGGDPVNFSDPFGLCPACAAAALLEFGLGAQVVPGVGTVLGGIAIATSAAVSGYALYKLYNEEAGEGSTGGPTAGKTATRGDRQAARDRNRAANADGELRCVHCGVETTEEPGKPTSSQIDHVQPRNPRDGGPRGNNDPSNLKNSCRTCNLDKSNKRPPYAPQ